MRTIGVSMRPHDERCLRLIMDYLGRTGIAVGTPTVSQAVRFAVEYTALGVSESHANEETVRSRPVADGPDTGPAVGPDCIAPVHE